MTFSQSHQHLSLYNHLIKVQFFPLYLFHLYLHDICLVNVFDSFIPVIMLNTFRFKSSVLFGIHILLDTSLIVLQLSILFSNLTVNG